MDKTELAVMRAEEAQRILASTIWTRAFDDVKAAIYATWAALPTADSESARDLHRRLKCLDDVKMAMTKHIQTGQLAQKEIEGRGNTHPLSLMGLRNALKRT